MNELKRYLPNKGDCADYTLFLDRDGVINRPIVDDYARVPEDFVFCDGAIEAITQLKRLFKRIVIVTNQQGVGREIMSSKDLENVHLKMYNGLKNKGVEYFDLVLYAPYIKTENHKWRKPQNGMLMKTKSSFPDIDWSKSIMVGDSHGDMQLADTLDILKVKIENPQFIFENQVFQFPSLIDFVASVSN
ncbi:HAD-IIIA family hydrolase [Bacteroidia bacterium]|nr:HAD-IIIA family hydrolase [Bacteroidia bacterium]